VNAVRRDAALSATISVWPDVAVRRLQVVGRAGHRAVGRDADGLPGPSLAAFVDALAHVADVRRAVVGHDHVVDRSPREPRQVSVLDDRAVVLDAQQLLRLHRDDQEATVRQPTET
jgi:hypothetical protein